MDTDYSLCWCTLCESLWADGFTASLHTAPTESLRHGGATEAGNVHCSFELHFDVLPLCFILQLPILL